MLNPATPAFLDTLRARLPAATFREAGPEHLQEPRGRYTGQGLLLAPSHRAAGSCSSVGSCLVSGGTTAKRQTGSSAYRR